MKGKRTFLVLVIVVACLAAGAFVYVKKSGLMSQQEQADGTTASATPGTTPTDPTAAAPAPAASAFDLTAQADGLSKAVATLTMDKGEVLKIRFFTNDAPNTTKRITQLISEGFYNGIVVHRVEPGFVIQAGDPTGTGAGGSGVKLKAEFNSHKHEAGIVSMARLPTDPNSADSQFFIMLGSAPSLDGGYTAFGKVVEGFEHTAKIQRGDKIKSFTIQ